MGNEPTRARRILTTALVFLLGVVAGGAGVAAVAAEASRAYLRGAQLTFATEQDRQLSNAWRAGDFEEALLHAGCAIEAEQGETAARTFDPARNKWSLSYALTEAIIVEPNRPTFEKARPGRVGKGTAR
jgi:hypothetical protein